MLFEMGVTFWSDVYYTKYQFDDDHFCYLDTL